MGDKERGKTGRRGDVKGYKEGDISRMEGGRRKGSDQRTQEVCWGDRLREGGVWAHR